MKICYFGIYDPAYSRNSILVSGLQQNGITVIECRADWRDPKRYRKLWTQLRALKNDYDYIYAAYPSSVPAVIAKIVSKKPVIIDAFYSNFDSVVNDRKKYTWFDPRSLKMLFFDWIGVMVADLIITDTDAHGRYWSSWWGIGRKKMGTVYIGADTSVFRPMEPVTKNHTLVLFHGTFIPLQGVLKIIEAASLCASEPSLRFRLVGDGRDFKPAKALAEKLQLKNIEFTGMVPLAEMGKHLVQADIVLGIFGDTAKAHRVIPNKVYEGLYSKRAVITMDGPVIREAFSDKDMLLVHNDPQSIAHGIIMLTRDTDMRTRFAQAGYEAMMRYTSKPLGKMLLDIISKNL